MAETVPAKKGIERQNNNNDNLDNLLIGASLRLPATKIGDGGIVALFLLLLMSRVIGGGRCAETPFILFL